MTVCNIFNSANFTSIAADAKGVIRIFNVGAERMLGCTLDYEGAYLRGLHSEGNEELEGKIAIISIL